MFEAKKQVTQQDRKFIFDGVSPEAMTEIKAHFDSLPTAAIRAKYIDSENSLPVAPNIARLHVSVMARSYVAFVEHYEKTRHERFNRYLAISAIVVSIIGLGFSFAGFK